MHIFIVVPLCLFSRCLLYMCLVFLALCVCVCVCACVCLSACLSVCLSVGSCLSEAVCQLIHAAAREISLCELWVYILHWCIRLKTEKQVLSVCTQLYSRERTNAYTDILRLENKGPSYRFRLKDIYCYFDLGWWWLCFNDLTWKLEKCTTSRPSAPGFFFFF
jgi:hypothetical protein